MKASFLVLVVALAFTFQALAADMKVRASEYRCADLQKLLNEQGSLYIMHGPADWGLTYKSQPQMCEPKWEARAAYVSTLDKYFCLVGWACARRP